jgi:hypothetical protein
MVLLLAKAQKKSESLGDARNTLAAGAKTFPSYRDYFLEIRSKIQIPAVTEQMAQKK